MKVLVCANLLVGDLGVLEMPTDVLMQWQHDKIEALGAVLEIGQKHGVDCCIMAGGLFTEGFIPQSLLEDTLKELSAHDLPVFWLPFDNEVKDLDTRISLPERVTVIRQTPYDLDAIHISHLESEITLAADTEHGTTTKTLGLMEPLGFDDLTNSDILIVDMDTSTVSRIEDIPCAKHPFLTITVDLDASTNSNEMIAVVQNAIDGLDANTCLRMVLKGAMKLSSHFNTEKLAQVLNNRFFYVEVSNECSIDIDEQELSSDVSLIAEFIRLVDADDSLSSSEKTRIMRCGWNAINGKELME